MGEEDTCEEDEGKKKKNYFTTFSIWGRIRVRPALKFRSFLLFD